MVQLENNPIQQLDFRAGFVFQCSAQVLPSDWGSGERPQRPTKYDFGQTLATGELVD